MSRKRKTRKEQTTVSPRSYGSPTPLRQVLTSWWVLGPVLMIMAAVLAWWLRIDSIQVQGTEEAELTKKVVQEQLDQNFLWNYSFLLPKEELINQINARTSHQYREININKGVQSLSLRFEPRTPQLVWHAQQAYVVDSAGVAYQPLSEENPQAVSVYDQAKLPVAPPQSVLDSATVDFLKQLPQAVREKTDFNPQRIIAGDTLHTFRLETKEGIELLFDPSRSLSDQIDSLTRTIKTAESEGKAINRYIDVRLPSRVFYK